MRSKGAWMIGFTVLCVVAALVAPPIAQPLSYHEFVDRREMLGVERFCDVASNLPFLAAGLLGLGIIAWRPAAFASPSERWPYVVFFAGLALTCFGSAYYHLVPGNARLVWDRLPITVTLAGLLVGQIADRVSVTTANRLLIPAVLVGAVSVWYWALTDNVVPYLVAQMYAAIAIVFICLLYPSRYTRGADIYWAFAFFMLSKLFEALDAAIFKALQVVSGHTLKHLAAAAAGFVVCAMLARRTVRTVRASP